MSPSTQPSAAPSCIPSTQPTSQPTFSPTNTYRSSVIYTLNSTLSGVSVEQFDGAAQTAFITAIASVIPNVSPSSITITRFYFIDVPDKRKLKGRQHLQAKQLVVEWKLNVVLQDVVELNGTPSSDSKTLIKEFSKTLQKTLTNSTMIAQALKEIDSFAFSDVEVISDILIISDPVEIFIKSSFPTSVPSGSPTGFFGNAILENVEEFSPLTASQFVWMISLVIIVFTFLPWAIFFYRKRGEQKQKAFMEKIDRLRFESNKRKLSEDVLRRRDEIRLAFRKTYGRDIEVFADCKDSSILAPKFVTPKRSPNGGSVAISFRPTHYMNNSSQNFAFQPKYTRQFKRPRNFFPEEREEAENKIKSKIIENDPNFDIL
jgi:hypothetical protein